MRFNTMRNVPTIFLLSALFLLASGLLEVEVGRVFGGAGSTLYAAGRSHSKVKSNRNTKKAEKKAEKKEEVPQEWQWFNGPIHFNAVSYSKDEPEVEQGSQKVNASFQLALAKMERIRSKRTARDLEILAKIKAEEKSISMVKMNKKVRELARRADMMAGGSPEPTAVEVPVVAPSFVLVPSSVKVESPKVDNRNHKRLSRAERRKARQEARRQAAAAKAKAKKEAEAAKSLANKAVEDVKAQAEEAQMNFSAEAQKAPILSGREVASGLTPSMSSDELNEMISIDDVVAVDNEPPAITPVGETVKTSVSKKVQGYNRYAHKPVEKVETLYKGIGSEYSERINEIVNERKDKIFGK